jgi:hypothetical protein
MFKSGFQLFSVVLLLMTTNLVFAQTGVSDHINREPDRAASLQILEKEAAKALEAKDYYTAMHRYKNLIEADSQRVSAYKGYGEASLGQTALERAEWAFTVLVNRYLNQSGPQSLLSLADVKYRLGKYKEAKLYYQRYLAEEKSTAISPEIMEKVQTNMDNCDWAMEIKPNDLLKTPLMLLDTHAINTKLYSEYSPYMVGDVLYFSSYRFPYEKDKHYPKRQLIKILEAEYKDTAFAAALVPFNTPDKHNAHMTLNQAQDRLYYCECAFVNDIDIRCDLVRRKLQADNSWGPSEKLPPYINAPGFTTTEPSVGKNGSGEFLYFVSDRPGGKGKRDIWYSKIIGDSLTVPVNLADLNTNENDVTPFYHSNSGILYFSTDGRQSMGGLDVYFSKGMPGQKWGAPEHMRVPINSGANDVFFSMNRDGAYVFLASNRRGDFNASEEACCYDLYKADLVAPKMLAVAFNKLTGDSLPYTTMRLIEMDDKGNIISDLPFALNGPTHEFNLQPGKKYMIIGQKDRFSNDTVRFDTPALTWTNTLVKKLYLEPAQVNLITTVLDRETGKPINGATALFYNFDPGTLQGVKPIEQTDANSNVYQYKLDFDRDYKVVVSKPGYTVDSTGIISTKGITKNTTIRDTLYLTRGVQLLAHTTDVLTKDTLYGVTYRLIELPAGKEKDKYINPLGKNYGTILAFDKRYRLIATKDGYTSDSVEITTLNMQQKDFNVIRRELRLRPLDISKYLPIRLFFDNDEPDKRTLAQTTNKEYRAAYVEYIRRKEEFMAKYTEGMTGTELQINTDTLEKFFETEVRAGWEHLMAFSEVLYDMMTRGDTIEITLKGYASPRAASAYNFNLTDRRVSSVYNHFDLFDGGIYKKFVDSKQLTFKREANGEAKSPTGISDDLKDERNSIYGVRASRERRLEIIGVRTNGNKQI